jgi:hypothetical protein
LSRNGYNNVIYITWDLPEAGDNLDVTNVTTAGANGIDGTRKPGRTQVIHPYGAGLY